MLIAISFSANSVKGRAALQLSREIGVQVKADLDPRRFTVRTVPALLAKTRVWQNYCDGQRSLEQAIKRLAKSIKQAA